jgi:lipopolysaccharide transport system ATP-binding protein
MSQDIVIRVEHLSKRFEKGRGSQDKSAETSNSGIWALKDVSFSITRGDRIGVLGPNGCGKSTLLKILSGISKPTQGRVEMHGKVASILDIGAGFHHELSGRENVFLSGQIHGFKQSEIRSRFDEIVGLSGVEDFIDEPVKNYSNGMTLRLAFSIVANLSFDTYLFDEVFSVGDAQFRSKCQDRINELISSGDKSIVLVSHDVAEIARVCNEVLLMRNGELIERSNVNQALLSYASYNTLLDARNQDYAYKASIDTINSEGSVKSVFVNTEPIEIVVHNTFGKAKRRTNIAIRMTDRLGNVVFNLSPILQKTGVHDIDFNEFSEFRTVIPPFTLNTGFFALDIVYFNNQGIVAELRKLHYFQVMLNDNLEHMALHGESGPIRPYFTWTMK